MRIHFQLPTVSNSQHLLLYDRKVGNLLNLDSNFKIPDFNIQEYEKIIQDKNMFLQHWNAQWQLLSVGHPGPCLAG